MLRHCGLERVHDRRGLHEADVRRMGVEEEVCVHDEDVLMATLRFGPAQSPEEQHLSRGRELGVADRPLVRKGIPKRLSSDHGWGNR
jgi:hypothetical protein